MISTKVLREERKEMGGRGEEGMRGKVEREGGGIVSCPDYFSPSGKINEVRCYEAKIEESEKGWQLPGVEPRTPLA